MKNLVEEKDGKLYYNGYCLVDLAKRFGTPLTITFLDIIKERILSLKEAFENAKKATLHPLSTIPNNVAVPVFTAQGTWGHVEVCLNGVYYSDGRMVGKPNSSYQWGEFLNGVRVVSYVHTGGGGSSFKVGDSVIVNGQGYATSKGTGARTKNFVNRKMKIISIANGRYGCNQYNRNGGITGWWSGGHLKKA